MAEERERELKKGQVKDDFVNFRKLRSAVLHVTSPILDTPGRLLCDRKAKLARWKEYYSDLLRKPIAEPPEDLIEAASSATVDNSIDCDKSTESEVYQAIGKLRNGRALGICGIPGELLKHGRSAVVSWLTQVFKGIWASGRVPHDWRKGIIISFTRIKAAGRNAKTTETSSCSAALVRCLLIFCWPESKTSCYLFVGQSSVASHIGDQQLTT